VLGVVSIHCDAAPTPSGFAEIVSDYFPVLHAGGFWRFRSPHGNDKVIYMGTMTFSAESSIATVLFYE
jgi:hypothetical protein